MNINNASITIDNTAVLDSEYVVIIDDIFNESGNLQPNLAGLLGNQDIPPGRI